MKFKMICFYCFLITLRVFSDQILPSFTAPQKVALSMTNNSFFDANAYSGERAFNLNGLFVKINGQQKTNDYDQLVERFDIIMEIPGKKFMFPYDKLGVDPVIQNVSIFPIENLDHQWILIIEAIDDGARGPKYTHINWFLIQSYQGMLFSSSSLFSDTNEERASGAAGIHIQQFGTKENLFYQIGKKYYIYENGLLVEDPRFISGHYESNRRGIVWESLNLRDEPGLNGERITVIPAGSRIKLLSYAGDVEFLDGMVNPWLQVKYYNVAEQKWYEGYVWGGYVK